MRSMWLAAALAAAAPATAGTVAGRVELIEKGGVKAADASDVVLWIGSLKAPHRPSKAIVTMKGKAFTPRLAVVPAGGTVEFPNDDPILHNVFSVSGPNRFDLALYRRPKSASWTFHHPGVVRVYCNIHPQMSAIVLVQESPHFARAGADGAFRLEGIPSGRHTLKAWHERAGEVTAEVAVPAEGTAAVSLTLDASRYRRLPHRRKDGSAYGAGERY